MNISYVMLNFRGLWILKYRSVNVDNDDGIFFCLIVLVDSLDKLVLNFLMVFVL